MSPTDFLRLNLRLLVCQFGRRAVVDALADVSELSPEQLETEIAGLQAKKVAKPLKREKCLDELLSEFTAQPEENRRMIAQIGRLYESKQFLPNLRDAQDFLHRAGAPGKKFKNRRAALAAILKATSQLTTSEMQSLISQLTSGQGQSDYALLANQLMGKGR